MKKLMKLLRAASFLGQLGFNLITPPVCLCLLAWWLQQRFGLGTWVTAVGLILGLMTAAANGWRFFRRLRASMEREEPKEKPVVFYRHE